MLLVALFAAMVSSASAHDSLSVSDVARARRGMQIWETFHKSARRTSGSEVTLKLNATCGATICDNAEVAASYVNELAHGRLKPVELRMKYVNIIYDNGTSPLVTTAAIQRNADEMNFFYKNGSMTINASIHTLKSTHLRLRNGNIVNMCEPRNIGNGACDWQCDKPITGHDGGDCAP